MALAVKLVGYAAACAAISGGVSRLWVFDNKDYTFTQAAFDPATGHAPYTAITAMTGADAAGAAMLPLKFERFEVEYTYKQSRKGRFSKYEHQLQFKMADLSQSLANWNVLLDAASACEGVGLIIQLVTGKILVMGEAIIGGNPIEVPMYVMQDGSSGTSGKVMDDFNGQDTILKTDYNRPLLEFTGGLAAITALE